MNVKIPKRMDFLASLSFARSAHYLVVSETVTMKGNKILNVYRIINLVEVCMCMVRIFVCDRILNGIDQG